MGRLDKDMDRVVSLLQRAERLLMISDARPAEKAKIQGHMKQCVKRCQDIQSDYLEFLSYGPSMED